MTGPDPKPDPAPEQQPAPLFLVRGDATDEEVAALTVALQALPASAPAPARPAPAQWSSPQRAVRSSYLSPGRPDGWRSSALPR